MRKPGFILLLLLCCLYFATDGRERHESLQTPAAELTLDRASDDAWRLERLCNSDLDLPRPARETAPRQTVRPAQHDGCTALRTQHRHWPGIRAGSAEETSVTHPLIRFSGVRAADYYVYRLRRIII